MSSRRSHPETHAFAKAHGFTLIELLIVVAIIAILAAIAVPNFLEAQTRSKVSRAKADMRSVVVGIEAYRTDFSKLPPTMGNPLRNGLPEWWGFTPACITTPVAYMASLPYMPFTDSSVTSFWMSFANKKTLGEAKTTQPYTYIMDTGVMVRDGYALAMAGTMHSYPAAGNAGLPANFNMGDARDFYTRVKSAGFLIYTSGPDGKDGTVWIRPATYDPSNGTVSFGDVHAFGTGTSDSSQKSGNR